MEIRQPVHSEHARTLDTESLRRHFLVDRLFRPDEATLTYSQIDRIIVGGVMPVTGPVGFAPELGRQTGTDFFLQRRELGLINVGGPARATVDGQVFEIGSREALYVGQGAKAVEFTSLDAANDDAVDLAVGQRGLLGHEQVLDQEVSAQPAGVEGSRLFAMDGLPDLHAFSWVRALALRQRGEGL